MGINSWRSTSRLILTRRMRIHKVTRKNSPELNPYLGIYSLLDLSTSWDRPFQIKSFAACTTWAVPGSRLIINFHSSRSYLWQLPCWFQSRTRPVVNQSTWSTSSNQDLSDESTLNNEPIYLNVIQQTCFSCRPINQWILRSINQSSATSNGRTSFLRWLFAASSMKT